MAKTKISEYSTTNSSNTDINSINIDEGCAPSGINNAIREVMVHLKNFQTGASSDPLTVAGTFVASGGATIAASAGTSASPSIYFSGDTNTGVFSPTADTVGLSTAGSERVRIDSSGNVLVGVTSATANGGVLQVSNGITFPATQSASTDANTLDDYEEGTFTATLKGSTTDPTTPVTSTAKYTKIGNVVYYQISFENVTTTGAAGDITITSLPFTPASGTTYRSAGCIAAYSIATWTGSPFSLVDGNLTTLYLYANASNSAWSALTHNAGTGRYLSVTGFYYV